MVESVICEKAKITRVYERLLLDQGSLWLLQIVNNWYFFCMY